MTLYDDVSRLKPGSIFTVGPTGRIGYLRTREGLADLAKVETGEADDAYGTIPGAWKDINPGIRVRFTHKTGWSTWTEA